MEEKELTYEAAMEQLEKQAREMENGDVAIDMLAAKLKDAQQLLQFCKDKLTKADEEVRKLVDEQG
jgi:exodeoxyribonuclease VII small subunit